MNLEINNYFGQTVLVEPKVQLYEVQDFMGQPMHGLAITLNCADGEYAGEPFANLTVSFGEFIGTKAYQWHWNLKYCHAEYAIAMDRNDPAFDDFYLGS